MELEPPFSPSVKSYKVGLDLDGGMSNKQTLMASTDVDGATMTLGGRKSSGSGYEFPEHTFSGSELISIPFPNYVYELKLTSNGHSTTYSIEVIEVVNPDPYNDDPGEPIGG